MKKYRDFFFFAKALLFCWLYVPHILLYIIIWGGKIRCSTNKKTNKYTFKRLLGICLFNTQQ